MQKEAAPALIVSFSRKFKNFPLIPQTHVMGPRVGKRVWEGKFFIFQAFQWRTGTRERQVGMSVGFPAIASALFHHLELFLRRGGSLLLSIVL